MTESRQTPSCVARLVLLLLLFACALSTPARDVDVRALSSHLEEGRLIIDATIDIRLSDSIREALENGVTLQFDLDTRLLRPRRLWWDGVLLQGTRHYQLSRHALADGYLVSEVDADNQQTYKRLDDALQALGTLDRFVAGTVDDDQPPPKYRGRLRLRLDIEALPAPLRPVAYVSPSWRVSSGWYEWSFAP